MLVIRDDQLTLAIADEKGFVDWYVGTFMPKFIPIYCDGETPESLRRKRTLYGRKLAISYSFIDPVHQAHFVTYMWEIGPRFYTFPGYKEIIDTPDQSSQKRIDRLYSEITERQEELAIEGFDEKDWNPQD